MKYYIADLHFGHTNIIKYDKRPFKNVQEMEEVLINNWNARVKDTDEVYILGDMFFKNTEDPINILKRLKGIKYLIKGNHDSNWLNLPGVKLFFKLIVNDYKVTDNGIKLWLYHYPVADWDGKFHGSYHVYGHIHNNVDDFMLYYIEHQLNAFNAGCMVNGYMPVTFEELKENNAIFRKDAKFYHSEYMRSLSGSLTKDERTQFKELVESFKP